MKKTATKRSVLGGPRKQSRTKPDSDRGSPATETRRRELIICAGLTLATLAVYGQVINHQFINLDDDVYLYENPIVMSGLTAKGFVWTFTTFHAANWHPLTWLSHMLDVQIFGPGPGPHLIVNVLFHVVNTLLLFVLLKYMTGAVWRSAIVAGLFALHPMHVESVAWAAERKDVLSTFFALLSLLAYVRYARAALTWKRFLPVSITLALALMAKPMFVTWPLVMLLLDYWPLDRLRWHPGDGFGRLLRGLAPLTREKIPLFLLSAGSIVITYIAQSRGGAVRPFTDAPILLRISNAVVSYARYVVALLWPSGLGVYYPFPPDGIPPRQIAASIVLVICITALAIRAIHRRRYVITGWAWYLGTLIPVIGLVQVGGQAMADRYSYIPSIGLFVIIVWGAAEFVAARRVQPMVTAFGATLCLLIIGWVAWIQVGFWQDSITLFRHTLSVAPDNLVIHYNLGHVLGKQGDASGAIEHFGETLRIKPDFFDALINIGITLNDQQRFTEGTTYLRRAVEIEPGSSKAHLQLAMALAQGGSPDEAMPHFYRALELAPGDPDVHTNLGLMLARRAKLPEAAAQLDEALRLNPDSPEAHNNLGLVLLMQGEPEASISHFSTALRLKPGFRLALDNLNRARTQLKTRPN